MPCSGLGIIGKKADIKYRIKAEDIEALVALQRKILTNAWRYVRPGGTLIYSTCTVSRAENEAQVQWLKDNFLLETVDISESLPENIYVRLQSRDISSCCRDNVTAMAFLLQSCAGRDKIRKNRV